MKKYLTYISEFHNSNPVEIEFVNNHLKKHLEKNPENQTEVETILDYLYSNQKVDISKFGYQIALEKTEKWHKKLQSVSSKDNEVEWKDYEVFLDFWDWFKVVRLISQECYQREGKLMSHCVSSYYGRSSKIFSLRDSENLPHCTIEDGNQIKGKWNGNIDPKYIDYIVKFLEKTWMTVGENEMRNLGYYKIEKIDEGLTSECAYNGYIYEGKLDTLRDKEWQKYEWFWLLKIKKLVEIGVNFSLKFNFDFDAMLSFFFRRSEQITAVTNESYSTAVTNESSSTAVTRW